MKEEAQLARTVRKAEAAAKREQRENERRLSNCLKAVWGPDPIKCSTPSRHPGKVPPPLERLGGAGGGSPPPKKQNAFWPSIDAVFDEFCTILKME